MRSKIKNLLGVLCIVLISTGCVKYNATMNISKDKSMDYEIIYAFDTSVFGDTEILDKDAQKEMEKNGYKLEEYKDGNMKGFKITMNIDNIDDISSESDVTYNLSDIQENDKNVKIFKVEKGFLKNTYTAKFEFNSSDSDLSGGDSTTSDYDDDDYDYDSDDTDFGDLGDMSQSMMSGLDLSFNVKLPYKAISNNASKTNDKDKQLTWTLTTTGENAIEFSFPIYNLTNLALVGGGILVLIALIAFIVIKNKKGKNTNVENTVNEVNSQPQPVVNQEQASNVNTVPQNIETVAPVAPIVEIQQPVNQQVQQPIEPVQNEEVTNLGEMNVQETIAEAQPIETVQSEEVTSLGEMNVQEPVTEAQPIETKQSEEVTSLGEMNVQEPVTEAQPIETEQSEEVTNLGEMNVQEPAQEAQPIETEQSEEVTNLGEITIQESVAEVQPVEPVQSEEITNLGEMSVQEPVQEVQPVETVQSEEVTNLGEMKSQEEIVKEQQAASAAEQLANITDPMDIFTEQPSDNN